jgi:hypothetical protein
LDAAVGVEPHFELGAAVGCRIQLQRLSTKRDGSKRVLASHVVEPATQELAAPAALSCQRALCLEAHGAARQVHSVRRRGCNNCREAQLRRVTVIQLNSPNSEHQVLCQRHPEASGTLEGRWYISNSGKTSAHARHAAVLLQPRGMAVLLPVNRLSSRVGSHRSAA